MDQKRRAERRRSDRTPVSAMNAQDKKIFKINFEASKLKKNFPDDRAGDP